MVAMVKTERPTQKKTGRLKSDASGAKQLAKDREGTVACMAADKKPKLLVSGVRQLLESGLSWLEVYRRLHDVNDGIVKCLFLSHDERVRLFHNQSKGPAYVLLVENALSFDGPACTDDVIVSEVLGEYAKHLAREGDLPTFDVKVENAITTLFVSREAYKKATVFDLIGQLRKQLTH